MKSYRFFAILFFVILLASLAFAISCGGDDDDDDDNNDDDNDDAGDDDNDDDAGDDDDDNDDDAGDDDDDDDTGDDDDDTGGGSLACDKETGEIGFIDFEDGTDKDVIASTIPGMEFSTTEGYDWVYGDWRTGDYNGSYPAGSFFSHGDFFAWLGERQGSGIITFASAYATYFQIHYSSESTLYLEAYDADGNILAEDSGPSNLDTGEMGVLRVDVLGMAYIIIHDTGNHWLIDDLETDARPY